MATNGIQLLVVTENQGFSALQVTADLSIIYRARTFRQRSPLLVMGFSYLYKWAMRRMLCDEVLLVSYVSGQ